jgi:Sap, sulfolipid-1-addressing protein
MLGEAIGDLLPSAVGVALSPIPIVAVILMLGTPRARSNGPAFAAGWVGSTNTVGCSPSSSTRSPKPASSWHRKGHGRAGTPSLWRRS